jgi:hypothetical protein
MEEASNQCYTAERLQHISLQACFMHVRMAVYSILQHQQWRACLAHVQG